MGKKKDKKKIKGLEQKLKELENQIVDELKNQDSIESEEEEYYVLSEAMIMSNAINDEIKDLQLLLGISRFDMELYGKIVDNFMNGMVRAGYISTETNAA